MCDIIREDYIAPQPNKMPIQTCTHTHPRSQTTPAPVTYWPKVWDRQNCLREPCVARIRRRFRSGQPNCPSSKRAIMIGSSSFNGDDDSGGIGDARSSWWPFVVTSIDRFGLFLDFDNNQTKCGVCDLDKVSWCTQFVWKWLVKRVKVRLLKAKHFVWLFWSTRKWITYGKLCF